MYRQSWIGFGTALALSALNFTAAQETTITVLGISAEQNELYRELEQAFQEEYPEWELNFETMSIDSFQQTLPLSFESGEAPDIFFIDGFDQLPLNDLLEANWVAPAAGDQEIPQEWFDRFPEGMFIDGHNMVNGTVYGIPLRDRTIYGHGYMYYNRTVLEAAGVDPESQIPTTWSELLAVCEQVTQSGNSCFSASFDSTSQFDRWWLPFTSVAETYNPINLQTGNFSYADPARLRAWELLKTLYDGEYFIPGVASTDRETSRQIFALDQAAFYVDGSWMPVVWDSMGFGDLNFGVAPIPVPDEEPRGKLAIGLIPSTIYVSSQADNPEAAWAVIEWLTRPEGPYAQGYVGGGFGFLTFTDNAQWIDPNDEVQQEIISIASDGYRIYEPVPLLACADMTQSTAYQDALQNTSLPDEQESIVEALVNGEDWTVTAQRLATGRQELFEANLAEEQEAGLNVSLDYYTYPDWSFDEDFDYGVYPLCP